MVVNPEITWTSFDSTTRKLEVKWKVDGYKLDTPVSVESKVFSHDESSPIKWRLGFKSTKQYLEPLSEVNSLFKYTLDYKRLFPNLLELSDENYLGQYLELPEVISLLVPVVHKLTLTYPPEALRYLAHKTEPLPVKLFTEETRNKFCDVKFMVQDHVVETHRIILANHSPVFMSMFTADTEEEPIEIEDASFDGFSKYLNLFYGPDVVLDDPTVSLEIMKLAERYDTQDIKQLIECRLIPSIDRSNVVRFLIAADMNVAQHLKKAAMEFLKKNPVHELPDFWELTRHHFDLLKEVLRLGFRAN